VISAPGNPDTHHAVDAGILGALGRNGYLVNVGRGSIVDTRALIDALAAGRLAGVALDVFEDEPRVPAELLTMSNVVLTPHAAGRSPEAREAMVDLLIENLRLHRAGRPLTTPIG
jgi:lactate dehydrogenase-like 2-hydroxyacid dehydrogenase